MALVLTFRKTINIEVFLFIQQTLFECLVDAGCHFGPRVSSHEQNIEITPIFRGLCSGDSLLVGGKFVVDGNSAALCIVSN